MVRSLLFTFVLISTLTAAEPKDLVREAATMFNEAKAEPRKYAEAATLFAQAAQAGELTAEQNAAWSYCRVRLAAEDWNSSKGEAGVAKRVIAEVEDALKLAPEYDELQKFGNDVLVAAGAKPIPKAKAPKPPETDTGWFALEGDNFKIRYPAAAKEQAEKLLKVAEEQRTVIFTRWSGPPNGAWTPKCEVVLHASAADFAHATGQPKEATGHALVNLGGGRVVLRRMDLRSDDDAIALDALPRELTHVILADLFPTAPPPKWAAEGMAALAMSQGTVDRYLLTATKLSATGKLPQTVTLLEMTAPPSEEQVTGVAVGSASLVEFLIKKKDERSFTIFVRDAKRYGVEKSLDRQFSFATYADLDQQWRKHLAK
ncbi:hypothetical protein BH11PLA2_BH11PLA2_13190 [soil metagenome]